MNYTMDVVSDNLHLHLGGILFPDLDQADRIYHAQAVELQHGSR